MVPRLRAEDDGDCMSSGYRNDDFNLSNEIKKYDKIIVITCLQKHTEK